jgi:O-methyltransferase involved in polyketide biosynthesis
MMASQSGSTLTRMTEGSGAPASIDTSVPNIARVYDYWLGGKDNFMADRKVAEEFAGVYPGIWELYRDNRRFVCRAVTWAVGQGIRQIIDLGSGLPTMLNTHDAARAVAPGARVAYVDNDPVVIRHADALLTKDNGLVAAQVDLTDPAAVWDDPQVRAVIDPAEPVCVLLAAVLHFFDADAARAVAAGYAELAVPGSVLAISLSRNDDQEQHVHAHATYTAAHLYSHSRADIESFFRGLELIPPGIALAQAWRGGMPSVPSAAKGSAYFLAGVGRVRG